MMLNSIIKREINHQRPFLPFCLKLTQKRVLATTNSPDVPEVTKREQCKQSADENPFYQKYYDKIKSVQSSASKTTAKNSNSNQEELRVRKGLQELEEMVENMPSITQINDVHPDKSREIKTSSRPKTALSSSRPKRLEDVVHLDLLMKHEAEEIRQIWSKQHSQIEDSIYSVMESDVYDKIYNVATQYPLFLYPLPRSNTSSSDASQESVGYEFFLGQFNHHVFYFTPLIVYQKYRENAPACLMMHHFPELSSEKKLVLMNGEFDKKIINLMEAQCLANQMNLLYAAPPDSKKKMLLHVFNKDPRSFDHSQLLQEFESSLVFRPPDVKQ